MGLLWEKLSNGHNVCPYRLNSPFCRLSLQPFPPANRHVKCCAGRGGGAGGWAATCQLSDGGGNGLRHLLFPDLFEAPKEFEIQTKSISVGFEAPSWAGGQSTHL